MADNDPHDREQLVAELVANQYAAIVARLLDIGLAKTRAEAPDVAREVRLAIENGAGVVLATEFLVGERIAVHCYVPAPDGSHRELFSCSKPLPPRPVSMAKH